MEATIKTKETKNGTRFIHYVDGKVVRTSNRAMEYVCVRKVNGEIKSYTLGSLKTCKAVIAANESNKSYNIATRDMLAGKITYREYFNIVGFNHAMIKDYFDNLEAYTDRTREQCIENCTNAINTYNNTTFEILKF